MKKKLLLAFILFIFSWIFSMNLFSNQPSGLEGSWEMISFKSSEIPLFNHLFLEIKKDGKNIVLIKKWGRNRGYTDIIRLKTDRTLNKIPVPNRNFSTNVFMGVSLKPDAPRLIRAWWKEEETVLKLDQTVTVSSSQGMRKIESEHIFKYRTETDTLVYTIQRNTRESGSPIQFFFKRKGTKSAYYMELEDDWAVKGKLPKQAFLISLQGLANLKGLDAAQHLYIKYGFDLKVERIGSQWGKEVNEQRYELVIIP